MYMKMQRAVPVIVYEGDVGAIGECEDVLRRLVPLDVIDAVRVVVVAGDDDAPDQLLCTLVLEVLRAVLKDHLPEGQNTQR